MAEKSKTYNMTQVAVDARVSVRTLSRWVKLGRVPTPLRNTRGWVFFTDAQRKKVLEYANGLITKEELQQVRKRQQRANREEARA